MTKMTKIDARSGNIRGPGRQKNACERDLRFRLESVDSCVGWLGSRGDLLADRSNSSRKSLMSKFQLFRVHGQNPVEKGHLSRIRGSIEPLVCIFNLVRQIDDQLGKAAKFAKVLVDVTNRSRLLAGLDG